MSIKQHLLSNILGRHFLAFLKPHSRCLKNIEKVSFNIASERSYVYILSGQKFIKNAQKNQFWQVFENLKLEVKQCYQIGQFLEDKNWRKLSIFEDSNVTFWMIFKQFVFSVKLQLVIFGHFWGRCHSYHFSSIKRNYVENVPSMPIDQNRNFF